MKELSAQAVVAGGGAGGFGAAYTLAEMGIKTVLIEKNPGLGGTCVYGGVNCFEPGVASGRLPQLLASRLLSIPQAAAVCRTIPNNMLFPENSPERKQGGYTWGLSVTDASASYEDTLKRCISLTGGNPDNYRRFQFEPEQMDAVMHQMINEHKNNITMLFETEFKGCDTDGGKITAVYAENKSDTYKIKADFFVDCTGDILLARAAGCETAIGTDAKDAYDEPSAGTHDPYAINGVSYVFRIRKSKNPMHIDFCPDPDAPFASTVACFNCYPCGDINVNMLPTLLGRDYLKAGGNAASLGEAAVRSYWHMLQTKENMKGWELVYMFLQAGVRESYRLVGRYVLKEQDIRGKSKILPPEKTAAVADHPTDVHGEGGGLGELQIPYYIPLDCMLPKEYDNLLVACRGASFSHIAASSARLTRTMMSMGESAGKYIAGKLTKI